MAGNNVGRAIEQDLNVKDLGSAHGICGWLDYPSSGVDKEIMHLA